ncbi:signal transduction histidine kinase [Dysgonomonas sp. PFB1-18]|uniref:DUF4293 domain-containing protein n=1 Tax=unclassified Dysgonomonas TaxID=2630389 RepID=UPI002473C5FF|nr:MULTISPECIES: DUF4293 domain-containing protein [unclassified Dysgonomonas]MDH6308824.1 signal transduction histidine kinase [Dysgonomonas sp. PF1-14]MDH6338480.1 signal transduction histidine kinase [Dysgonomonas sp. PF1-16]MDH6380073.1 signal transduction histidine kinase [Dysgonomonas sp. PFB1-18]MDH6397308.1 signal transduction histidine kinase [Dysgonomonas sp. PF1-23]
MIQRIQSIFLLLVAILMGIALYFPISEVVDNDGISVMYHSYGLEIAGDKLPVWKDQVSSITWGSLTFALLSIITPLVAIFLYKNRKRQARITLFNTLFIVLYYVAVVSYFCAFINKIDSEDANIHINLTPSSLIILLPLVALIFNFLAYWRIRKDEKLVKSLDRIR